MFRAKKNSDILKTRIFITTFSLKHSSLRRLYDIHRG